MVKAEGFKNKITKAQEELFKALEAEKEKKKVLSDKIILELSKQEKANVRTLNSLNKEYLEQCANNKEKLESFISEIENLNVEIQNLIDSYNTHIQEHDEYQMLKDNDEANVIAAKNKFKREIQDINIKIDRIDKELKEIIETRTSEHEEEFNSFKSKVVEIDKRKKYDIGRIQNNTIKEYDTLQKLLLKENKKSEIKNINKNIKQIRYAGLISEKECMFRYLAEQRQFELDFAKYEYDYKCESSRLTKEYCDRIEDTKFDRSLIEFNFKKNSNKNDNDIKHTFNNNDKNYKDNYNNQLKGLYDKYNDLVNSQYAFENEKSDSEMNVTKKIYQDILSNDENQAVKLIDFSNKELALVNKDLALFKKNIHLTVTFYMQNIVATYTNYFKKFMKKEEVFINTLIVNSMKGAFLQGNNYDEYVNQVKGIFEAFKESEDKYIESFNEYLHNALNNLLLQVDGFITQIEALNDDIIKIETEYHESINKVLSEARDNGYQFVNAINSKEKDEIVIKVNENNSLYDKRNNELTEFSNQVLMEFNTREANVKNIEDALEVEYQTEYQELEKVKNEAKEVIGIKYNNELNQYSNEYQEKINSINAKFDDEVKNVEKQYKVKMGLL